MSLFATIVAFMVVMVGLAIVAAFLPRPSRECPNCGKDVALTAPRCRNCGYPFR